MSSEPTVEQVRDWRRRLSRLQDEMEQTFGEAAPGLYDDKLPTLVRFAWEEAVDMERRLERKDVVW